MTKTQDKLKVNRTTFNTYVRDRVLLPNIGNPNVEPKTDNFAFSKADAIAIGQLRDRVKVLSELFKIEKDIFSNDYTDINLLFEAMKIGYSARSNKSVGLTRYSPSSSVYVRAFNELVSIVIPVIEHYQALFGFETSILKARPFIRAHSQGNYFRCYLDHTGIAYRQAMLGVTMVRFNNEVKDLISENSKASNRETRDKVISLVSLADEFMTELTIVTDSYSNNKWEPF